MHGYKSTVRVLMLSFLGKPGTVSGDAGNLLSIAMERVTSDGVQ